MKQTWFGLAEGTKGVLAGIASALFLTAYLVVNKYVYNTYEIGAIEYSLIFALAGGVFGALSLARHMNGAVFAKVKKMLVYLPFYRSPVLWPWGFWLLASATRHR